MLKPDIRQGAAVSSASAARKVAPSHTPISSAQRKVIYLACPYTDPSPAVRRERFEAATAAAAELIRQGEIVYSPITMTHPIDMVLAGASNTLGSDYWVAFDEAFMNFCDEMVILDIDGWDRSNGIARERSYFAEHGKPIRFMSKITAGRV